MKRQLLRINLTDKDSVPKMNQKKMAIVEFKKNQYKLIMVNGVNSNSDYSIITLKSIIKVKNIHSPGKHSTDILQLTFADKVQLGIINEPFNCEAFVKAAIGLLLLLILAAEPLIINDDEILL